MSKSSGISASLELAEGGKFRVILSSEGDGKPFSVTVTVDDEATARNLCKKWKSNCSKVPEELIRLITSD